MAADSPVQRLQDEASCSICLEYSKDPESIHCGHNCCRACITNYWEESDTNFSCPQYRETAQQRNFRHYRELAKIIKITKRLSLQAAKGSGGKRVCEKHQETLKLCCEEDQAPICVICRESQAHRAHTVVPIEEAAQEYKEKIQIQLQILKEEREKLMGLKLTKEASIWEHLEQVETERLKILSEFEQLRQFLEEQERLLLAQLENLDKEIEKRRDENIAKLVEEISSLNDMISELEGKCQQPVSEFLQDVRSTLSRPLQFGKCWIRRDSLGLEPDVTLDPDTAHPRLVLSEDGKSVRWEDTRQHVPDNPKRFDSSRCVLGLEGFSLGRHYWEVEVEDGGAWAVGVARESVRRKGRVNVNPEEGIWAVGQCGTQYLALTSPKIPLSLAERPRTIGIYLDCEEGRVAFFDADNEAPIFTFPPGSVPGEKILPLLCLGRASQFRLCPCITGYNVEP
nr:E3 ubiquitin-protein ligase TRIM39-like [Chelonoidis abingdonii]